MARCPHCLAEVPDNAHYCTHCGVELTRKPAPEEQPPLPFSPWGLPPMAPQPAGADGTASGMAPVVGPPLSARQVAMSVAAILLFLVLVIILGRWYRGGVATTPASHLPVLGHIGQPITIGETVLGVAFTDSPSHFETHVARKGRLLSVGVVVGNRGDKAFLVDRAALALDNGDDGQRYLPIAAVWGTPEGLQAGQHLTRYALPPHETVAGLVVFDLPTSVAKPRLLLRDLNETSATFSGAIDLTEKDKGTAGTQRTKGTYLRYLQTRACPTIEYAPPGSSIYDIDTLQ